MSEEVTVREARHGDFEAVMEIGDVYGGTDIVHACFHEFIDDPNIYAVVGVIGEKPVGFYFLHVLDEGESANKRAGRVHKDYRSLGLFQKMTRELDRKVQEIKPPIKRYTFSNTSTNADLYADFYRKEGWVEQFRRPVVYLRCNVQSIPPVKEPEQNSSMWKMSVKDIQLFLKDKTMIEAFLPHSMFFNFYMGYKPVAGNIKYLVNDHAEMYATFECDGIRKIRKQNGFDSLKVGENNLDLDMMKTIDLISCSTSMKSDTGATIYSIDMYSPTYPRAAMEKHLTAHAEFIRNTQSDGVVLVTVNDDRMVGDAVAILADCGIVDRLNNFETHKAWWEKHL